MEKQTGDERRKRAGDREGWRRVVSSPALPFLLFLWGNMGLQSPRGWGQSTVELGGIHLGKSWFAKLQQQGRHGVKSL